MSLELLFEKDICEKELKIVLYENFQFEFKGRNHGTGLTELDWLKDIIKTISRALDYLVRRDFNIEQLGHLEGDQYKDDYYGYGVHLDVIKKLSKIIQEIEKKLKEHKQSHLFYENPKGKLLELFQKYGFPLPIFDTQRVGGTDNLPQYKCILKGNFFGKEIQIESDLSNNKKETEKDAAVKFQMALENESEFNSLIKNREDKVEVTSFSTQSLNQDELILSKKSIQGGYFKPEKIRLSTGTNETLYEWAMRKSTKKPFSALYLLNARLECVRGSSWHLSLSNGELILLNMRFNEQDYFEIGFAESKSKAKKDAAKRIIENSNLLEWLKDNYSDKFI